MNNTITIASPNAQPFGLLSNDAVASFSIDSKLVPDDKFYFKRGEGWKTVSQYVFINMFKDENLRIKMSERLGHSPFLEMTTMRDAEDLEIYKKSVFIAMKKRFEQDRELKSFLITETRGKQIVHDDKELVKFLNSERELRRGMVYDPKTGREIPMTDVLKTINGVRNKILNDPFSIKDSWDYSQLEKFATNSYIDIPPSDDIFLNVNYIGQIMKYRLRRDLVQRDIVSFKNHLLDVALDVVLEDEYPNVEFSDYPEAKRQQILKESNVELYKEQLYDLYIKGRLRGDKILSRLEFTPDDNLENIGKSWADLEENLLLPKTTQDIYVITPNSPLLPHHPKPVTIDGKTFNSPIYYAYAAMIANLASIGQLPDGFDNLDVNAIPLDSLVAEYNNLKKNWIYNNLKTNNEIATTAKFETHSVLKHLLLATRNFKLVWMGDSSDVVLGGDDNATGSFLEFLRFEYFTKGNVPNPLLSTYPSIAANVYTNFLMMAKAENFRNTMSLLYRPTTKTLKMIYGVEEIPPDAFTSKPGEADVESLRRVGLKNDEIELFFPFFLTEYWKFAERPESDIVHTIVNEHFKIVEFYDKNPEAYKLDLDKAKVRLWKMTKRFTLKTKIYGELFSMRVLAGKNTESFLDAKMENVYFWARDYKYL
jgi:predicted NAD-dependent protein-ADP-ribosyltransferase YbiA (DUF1768 family)